jgi:SAM-dependent methyltransferase
MREMREVWDAVAATGSEESIGRADAAATQLDRLFGQLGGPPSADGTCIEIGCGPGRMTAELVKRFREVVAVDVSPEMVALARERLPSPNVRFLVTDRRLDGVADESGDAVVCFGVVQHLPTRGHIVEMLHEVARVLKPAGEAFMQLPVLDDGLRPRAWRLARTARMRALPPRVPTDEPAYRGERLTGRELADALAAARLRVISRVDGDVDPTLRSRYAYARDTRLRLSRGS